MIRAFKSTLEDMEEKRSIHSLRSSGANRLPRPMSDMSYIDEDATGVTTATAAACATAGVPISASIRNSNGGGRTHLQPGGSSSRKTNLASCTTTAAASSSVVDHYYKVEGQAYRHHQQQLRGASQQQQQQRAQQQQQQQQQPARSRRCSDAQTQSAESSFDNNMPTNLSSCDALTTTNYNNHFAPPSPSPFAHDPMTSTTPMLPSVQVGVPSRGPSPVLIAPAAAAPSSSPLMTYGYDPTYCQYLGQAADGYQYELVRRPSIGPPELTIPAAAYAAAAAAAQQPQQQQQYLRRPSTGAPPYPSPQPHSPIPPQMQQQPQYSAVTQHQQYALMQNSLQGSFDSSVGPPVTPIFIQNSDNSLAAPAAVATASASPSLQQPLSPRHLHHHSSSSFVPHASKKLDQQPKLIHETSI